VIEPEPTHMTLEAFMRLHQIKATSRERQGHGQELWRKSRAEGRQIMRVAHPVFAYVAAYEVGLLRQHFGVKDGS